MNEPGEFRSHQLPASSSNTTTNHIEINRGESMTNPLSTTTIRTLPSDGILQGQPQESSQGAKIREPQESEGLEPDAQQQQRRAAQTLCVQGSCIRDGYLISPQGKRVTWMVSDDIQRGDLTSPHIVPHRPTMAIHRSSALAQLMQEHDLIERVHKTTLKQIAGALNAILQGDCMMDAHDPNGMWWALRRLEARCCEILNIERPLRKSPPYSSGIQIRMAHQDLKAWLRLPLGPGAYNWITRGGELDQTGLELMMASLEETTSHTDTPASRPERQHTQGNPHAIRWANLTQGTRCGWDQTPFFLMLEDTQGRIWQIDESTHVGPGSMLMKDAIKHMERFQPALDAESEISLVIHTRAQGDRSWAIWDLMLSESRKRRWVTHNGKGRNMTAIWEGYYNLPRRTIVGQDIFTPPIDPPWINNGDENALGVDLRRTMLGQLDPALPEAVIPSDDWARIAVEAAEMCLDQPLNSENAQLCKRIIERFSGRDANYKLCGPITVHIQEINALEQASEHPDFRAREVGDHLNRLLGRLKK